MISSCGSRSRAGRGWATGSLHPGVGSWRLLRKPKPSAAVPADLLPIIRESGVLSDRIFAEVKAKVLAGDYPFETSALALRLVKDRVLTEYQTRRFLAGKAGGLLVGRYVIVDRLGSGSMGRVYKAHHLMMDRYVALKIIAPEIVTNEKVVSRFQREMRLVGRLDHPNVIRAFDADQINKVLYIVMEYVQGDSLAQRLRKGPTPAGDGRLRRPGRPGTLPRARAGDHPPGHQAVQPSAHAGGVADQGARPRPRRPHGGGQFHFVRHGRRDRGRDRRLHVPGAGLRARGGRAERPVQPRLFHVPPDDGKTTLPRGFPDRAYGQADQRQARADHRGPRGTSLSGARPERIDRLLANRPQDRIQTATEVAEALQSLARPRARPVSGDAKGGRGTDAPTVCPPRASRAASSSRSARIIPPGSGPSLGLPRNARRSP